MPIAPHREAVLEAIERRSDIGGRFTNIVRIDPIGGGGNFSLILKATDVTTDKQVVIKVMDTLSSPDAYRRLCFDREASMLTQLSSRHDVVDLVAPRDELRVALALDSGPAFELMFPYYAMELARGSVEELVLHGSAGPIRRLEIFRDIVKAVQWLHARNIVHRDLKPANVLICRNGRVTLGDFGTSRDLGAAPILARYFGPPGDLRYTPPELLAGLTDDDPLLFKTADMFSLGAILFELFAEVPLGLVLYERAFVNSFMSTMAVVSPRDRRRVFDGVIGSVADARPLPSVGKSGRAPGSIRLHVDGLVRDLAALDYRKRPHDFASAFHRIDICLIVLQHEERQRRRLRFRRRVTRAKQRIAG